MGENSKIEWTHHTFNPWRGCTKVSQGCKNCYAETMSARNPGTLGIWGPKGTRVIAAESYWRQPLKWDREAAAAGERRRVFCASLADVFEGPETMPRGSWEAVEAARLRLFNMIMATPNLDWLLLTKRPENIRPALERMPVLKRDNVWDHLWPKHFPNVWIGTSVEDQAAADQRIPELLKVPAAVRFLSCEPLIGPVDIAAAYPDLGPMTTFGFTDGFGYEALIDWVICGGESGPGARPMAPAWARSLRDQCTAAGVPFLFKQWGEYTPYYEAIVPETGELMQVELPEGRMRRVGKHAAGRQLDGRLWDEFPRPRVVA